MSKINGSFTEYHENYKQRLQQMRELDMRMNRREGIPAGPCKTPPSDKIYETPTFAERLLMNRRPEDNKTTLKSWSREAEEEYEEMQENAEWIFINGFIR